MGKWRHKRFNNSSKAEQLVRGENGTELSSARLQGPLHNAQHSIPATGGVCPTEAHHPKVTINYHFLNIISNGK